MWLRNSYAIGHNIAGAGQAIACPPHIYALKPRLCIYIPDHIQNTNIMTFNCKFYNPDKFSLFQNYLISNFRSYLPALYYYYFLSTFQDIRDRFACLRCGAGGHFVSSRSALWAPGVTLINYKGTTSLDTYILLL